MNMLRSSIDGGALATGLWLLAALCAGLAVYAMLAGPGHLRALQDAAPALTVPVQAAVTSAPVAADMAAFYDGSLPRRAADGRTPFAAFRAPAPPVPQGRGRIALMVADFGLSQSGSAAALTTLPPEAAPILSPYAPDATKWSARAREGGREVWLHLPLVQEGEGDAGPAALSPSMGVVEGSKALHAALGVTQGYVGVAGFFGSSVSPEAPAVQTVLEEVFVRGLALAQIAPPSADEDADLLAAMARTHEAPYVRADMVLAPETPQDIPAALARAEEVAHIKGQALVVIAPWPSVMGRVSEWAKGLEGSGLVLVPPSALTEPLVEKQETENANSDH